MRKLSTLICCFVAGTTLTGYSALMGSTTDAFADVGDLAAYVPIDGNGSSIQTVLLGSSLSDGSHLDGADDGYAHLHRTRTSSDTIGLTRELGTIGAADVGRILTIDAALSVPDSNLNSVWEIQLNGTGVGGQGKMVINTFSTGNAPGGNAPLLLSTVALGTINSQRSATGPLTYEIQASDVGKSVALRFDHYDSSNNGSAEGTRNLNVDAIRYSVLPETDPNPPVFSQDPIIGNPATNNLPYSGSIAGLASDPDGDNLTYSKISGADWLSVLPDGTLYGSPQSTDAGVNAFIMAADNGAGGVATATLEIDVEQISTNMSWLWSQFVSARNAGGEATLTDFSYAGYHRCEIPVPEVTESSHTFFDVTDYGAIPDDGNSDRDAALSTFAAAHSHPGPAVIYFPEGRFLLDELSDLGKAPLEVKRSNMVIKGAGIGETELKFSEFNRFGDYALKFRSSSGELSDYWRGDQLMAGQITEQLDEFSVRVDNPSGLVAGQRINFSCIFPSLLPSATEYFAPHAVPQGIIDRHDGLINDIFEVHEIESVQGNVVTFSEPIFLDLPYFVTRRIYRLDDTIEECGLEDLSLSGGWRGQFSHHNGSRQGEFHNILGYDHVFHSWARRLRITDYSIAMKVTLSGFNTFSDIVFEGNAGHNLVTVQRSTGNLFAYVREQTDTHHGLGGSTGGAGTVFLRCTQYGNLEAHCGFIRNSLYDCNEGVFTMFRPGGAVKFPHHDKGLTFWNWDNTQSGSYDFWPLGANYGYFMPPVIAGMHGENATIADVATDVLALESHGQAVEPASLFEAQLALRMGGLPDWFDEQSVSFEAAGRNARISVASPVDHSSFASLAPVMLTASVPGSLDASQIARVDFAVSGLSRWDGFEDLPKADAAAMSVSFTPPYEGVWMVKARLTNVRGEISWSEPTAYHFDAAAPSAASVSSSTMITGADKKSLYGSFTAVGGGEAPVATGSAVLAAKPSTQPYHEVAVAYEAERQGIYSDFGVNTMAPYLSDAGRIAAAGKFFDNNSGTSGSVYYYLDSLVQAVFAGPQRINRLDIHWSGNAPSSGVKLEIQTPLNYPACLNSVVNDEPLWEYGICRIGGTLRQEVLHSSGGVTTLYFPERTAQAVRLLFGNFDGTIAELKFYGPESDRPVDYYLSWMEGHGLTGLAAGYAADPDADFRANLGEYAIGGIPTIGSNSPSEFPNSGVVKDGGTNGLEYIHPRRRNASALGLTYAVEFTEDLMTNTWSTVGVSEIGTVVVDDDFESVTNRVSMDDTTHGFVRLRVEINN